MFLVTLKLGFTQMYYQFSRRMNIILQFYLTHIIYVYAYKIILKY